MITTRKELKQYLMADVLRYGRKVPGFKERLYCNEKWYIYKYVRSLRHYEYYYNSRRMGGVATKTILFLPYLYWFFKYKRLSFKTHITILPNTCGPGLMVYHIGDMIWVKSQAKLGSNCTLRAGVVIGNKGEGEDNDFVIIGDNVDFGLGVKLFGPLTIGSNVTVGANAVITKDIPDNAIVAGVPAKIIRFKNDNNR